MSEKIAFCHDFYVYSGYFKISLNSCYIFQTNNPTTQTKHVMKATELLKILRPVVHIYTYTKSATSVLLILRKNDPNWNYGSIPLLVSKMDMFL